MRTSKLSAVIRCNRMTVFAEIKRTYLVTTQLFLVELQQFVSKNNTVYCRGGCNFMFRRDGFPTLHPIYFPILLLSFSIYKPAAKQLSSAVGSAERCMHHPLGLMRSPRRKSCRALCGVKQHFWRYYELLSLFAVVYSYFVTGD